MGSNGVMNVTTWAAVRPELSNLSHTYDKLPELQELIVCQYF